MAMFIAMKTSREFGKCFNLSYKELMTQTDLILEIEGVKEMEHKQETTIDKLESVRKRIRQRVSGSHSVSVQDAKSILQEMTEKGIGAPPPKE